MELLHEQTFAAADLAEAGVHSVCRSEIPVNYRNSVFPLPDPEEGFRLIQAFMSIRQAALREAITKFVAQISALTSDHPRPSA